MKNRRRDKTEIKRLENKLFQALLTLESVDDCRRFFTDLCTPAEMEALCDRWDTVGRLMKNETYREIAEKTGVSLTTIGRVSRCLHGNDGGYRLVLQKQGEWKNA
jgi:TrpR-related protein YerC/YecD